MNHLILAALLIFVHSAYASVPPIKATQAKLASTPTSEQLLRQKLQERMKNSSQNPYSASLIFDLPVTYNSKVKAWIEYFQGRGQKSFKEWLERSTRYMPMIQDELKRAALPQDLVYMSMIESGFSPMAVSHADAVGPWQFIQATGERYGLHTSWWLDERRDFKKSTLAATKYIRDLYSEFGSWYLVAASYNMGENGLRRLIQKYKTKDFWQLARMNALPQETQDYVPKILAAMLIAKSPSLYGFRDLTQQPSLDYEIVMVPGGVNLDALAKHLGLTQKYLKDLNAELLQSYVPREIKSHPIRVPKGARGMVMDFLEKEHFQNPQVAME